MKSKFKIVLAILMFVIFSNGNAETRYYHISLLPEICEIESYHLYDNTDMTNRVNFSSIDCGIGQDDGIEIHGLTNEILVYEIWDADGTVCLAYFTDEESFIESLFSMTGSFQLKFYFEDYILYGEISL